MKKLNPNLEVYGDIKRMHQPRYVDIISGGFPCQDISISGSMEGIKGERSGLWSEMYRVIRMVRPKYVIIENSPALTFRGFEQVLCDLSKAGYNAEWQSLSNNAFGYPHRRERLYVIAYSDEMRLQSGICNDGSFNSIFKQFASEKTTSYTLSERIYQIPNATNIRTGNGVRHWTQRVGSLGNAVNPTLAYYLFECIKQHINRYTT